VKNIFCSPSPALVLASGLASAVLSVTSNDGTTAAVVWTFGGTEPHHWTFDYSTNRGETWTWGTSSLGYHTGEVGVNFADSVFPMVRIWGADVGGLAVTDVSNAVELKMPAPILDTPSMGYFTIEWHGTRPFDWNIEQSDDGVTGWTTYFIADGAATDQDGLITDTYYRITGRNSDTSAYTPVSNVIQAT
jgi:hypothetical protein